LKAFFSSFFACIVREICGLYFFETRSVLVKKHRILLVFSSLMGLVFRVKI
jgi:hypothetical protein